MGRKKLLEKQSLGLFYVGGQVLQAEYPTVQRLVPVDLSAYLL